MELNSLQDVRVITIKYVACVVSDGNGDEKLVVRAPGFAEYHTEIVEMLQREAKNLSVRCIGGGRITLDLKAKTVEIYGSSNEFGREPDRSQTVAVLKTAFPDFEVTAL